MLSTKIHAPRRRDDLLVRERLLAALADGGAPLALVLGPAGSGKTVLVRQWLDRHGQPAAWLTVDPRDNDPVRFWTYLAAAVSASFVELGWTAGDRVTTESLDDLVDQLAALAPMVLVLDDLHFLVEAEVVSQLGRLIDNVPPQVRLVLVCRAAPAVRLARHRAAGRLVEVSGRELLFTDAEIEQLLGSRGNDALTGAVQECTGGWPVAVGFATHLTERDRDQVRTTPTARSRQQIADYLTEEVLRTQPDDVQDFLLDTSILDELTVAAADAVRGVRDASAHLHHLQRHDIFLSPLDGTGVDTWRHHALVRDHLRRSLERTQPERWRQVHTRAAHFYAASDPERAIGHALAAPDFDRAADLIEAILERHARAEQRASRHRPLRWLEALPDHIHTQRQSLRSSGLSLAASIGRLDLVERWLAARPAGRPELLEESFAQAWRADIAGDMPKLADAGRRALALCEPESSWWYAICNLLAPAEHMLGQVDAEIAILTALQFPLPASLSPHIGTGQEFFRALTAVLRARQGAPRMAADALQVLRRWLQEAACRGYESVGIAAWAEAMVAFHAGDVASASRWDRLPDDAVVDQGPLPPMMFRLDMARVRRAAGDREQGARLLADVRRRLADYADPGLFAGWVAAEEAALGVAATRPAPPVSAGGPAAPLPLELLSGREQEVLRMLRSEFTIPEIAAHLFVSYNTAKSHTRTIYRKLGVSSRSAAVARGRVLGYL